MNHGDMQCAVSFSHTLYIFLLVCAPFPLLLVGSFRIFFSSLLLVLYRQYDEQSFPSYSPILIYVARFDLAV